MQSFLNGIQPKCSQYFENRVKMINGFKETREIDPYPHKFQVTLSLPEFIAKYNVCMVVSQLCTAVIAWHWCSLL
jgi:lysyl-tRNA synthetase class 2